MGPSPDGGVGIPPGVWGLAIEELVAPSGKLTVAVGDAARGVRRPPQRDRAVRDRDVGVVVLALCELCNPVHEGDRLEERLVLVRPLQRTVRFVPVVHVPTVAAT